nr:DNA (cytosine-5-)-methyltransferase [Mycobacterium persicum]
MTTLVSLFDGIGGFPLAFERAGARTVATVEIDRAAAAVSARHFPHATQFDDVTKVTADDLRTAGFVPDRGIITAGWPCQDNSVAGRRAGMDGARSGLWREVVRLLAETSSRWFIGENVPGLLSVNNGRDFGAVLGSLAQLGYGVSYRILDAQYFGVPQRRDRVFIVGHRGTPWTAPAEVLFEPESGARDSAAGEPQRAPVAASADGSIAGGGEPAMTHTHTHTQRLRRCRVAGSADTGSTPNRQRAVIWSSPTVGAMTTSRVGEAWAVSTKTVLRRGIASCNRSEGGAELEIGAEGDPYFALRAGDGGSSRNQLIFVKRRRAGEHDDSPESWGEGEVAPTLDASGHGPRTATAVASVTGDIAHTLTAEGHDASEDGTERGTPIIASDDLAVRRLTELECERLQGFPDKWTEGQSGSARYRQLGNSVAVPVVEWIAHRLMAADRELGA